MEYSFRAIPVSPQSLHAWDMQIARCLRSRAETVRQPACSFLTALGILVPSSLYAEVAATELIIAVEQDPSTACLLRSWLRSLIPGKSLSSRSHFRMERICYSLARLGFTFIHPRSGPPKQFVQDYLTLPLRYLGPPPAGLSLRPTSVFHSQVLPEGRPPDAVVCVSNHRLPFCQIPSLIFDPTSPPYVGPDTDPAAVVTIFTDGSFCSMTKRAGVAVVIILLTPCSPTPFLLATSLRARC